MGTVAGVLALGMLLVPAGRPAQAAVAMDTVEAPQLSQRAPAADLPTVLTVTPPSGLVQVGQTFTVSVAINTTPASRGAQFALDFDPTAIHCQAVSEGSFYKTWAQANGGDTYFSVLPLPACDNAAGHVNDAAIAVTTIQPGGATGQGAVVQYRFTRVGRGASPLTLANVTVADDNVDRAQPLPTTVHNGRLSTLVQVYLPGLHR
jgi:hypothetical protein